jgi:hypothetical protein
VENPVHVASLDMHSNVSNTIYKDDTLCYTSTKVKTCHFADYCVTMRSPGGGMVSKKEGTSMAGWEQELAGLLRELGVTQEEPTTPPRFSSKLMHSDVKRRERNADAIFLGDIKESESADEEVWMSDLAMMRREIDSIVRQVIHLMQHGDLDPSLKEDVMVVLRALRRRSAVTQQAATGDEAYLESAAAMLHFCRLVLRLSETAIEDM